MPSQPTTTTIHANNVMLYFTGVVDSLQVLADSFELPFLGVISQTAKSLLTAAESVKQNKSGCIRLTEQTYTVLYGIVAVHIKSETGPDLPPSMLNHLGKFTETLYKIHTYVEAQQEKSKIRHIFRHSEMSTLLKKCNSGLQEALDVFQVQNVNLLENAVQIQRYSEQQHQEVLDLIETLSTGDTASFTSRVFSSSYNSSNSISMLPSEPKIFHGRESELSEILKILPGETAKIAILGAGGIGKTSLAKAVLHHPQIIHHYEQRRYFVTCNSASTTGELVTLIGAHLGLKPGMDLTRPIIQYFSTKPAALLILDNLETLWEPKETRGDIEELLSLLTDIKHLALMITMRGAQRPAKVHWSQPFLSMLEPLSFAASRQTFIDIAEDFHDAFELDKVLGLTGNIPLAVNLMAHLVDSEGCYHVLARWETEKTGVISEGLDQRSNLDLSISLSLTSPRIMALPQSKDLLCLLSMLPDGIADVELLQSKLDIDDILACKSVLLGTCLAYMDDQKQLKVLVPIREYMQQNYSPNSHLVQPLLQHFQGLLEFYNKFRGTLSCASIEKRVSKNFANIQNVLHHFLRHGNPDLVKTIYCTLHLYNSTPTTYTPLLKLIPGLLPERSDHALEVYWISHQLNSWRETDIPEFESLVDKGKQHLPHINNSDLKCGFYNTLGRYYQYHDNDIPTAVNCFQTALSLATSAGNTMRESQILSNLAKVKWQLGDYCAGQVHAHEAQRVARISGHLWAEASAAQIKASCFSGLGQYQQSLLLYSRARDLLGHCGMTGGDVDHQIMNTQAEIHRLKSEYLEAQEVHEEILHSTSLEGNPFLHAFTLLSLADIGVPIGKPKHEIQGVIDTVKSLFSNVSFTPGIIMCDATLGTLNLREKDLISAEMLLQRCLSFSWGKQAEITTFCLERLANNSLWSTSNLPVCGRRQWPSSWTAVYLAHALKTKQKLDLYKALQFQASLFRVEGDQKTATSLFTVALDGFTQMDVHCSRAECMVQLGEISKGRNDLTNALEFWTKARPLFERSSQAKQVALMNEQLANSIADGVETQEMAFAYLSELNTPTNAYIEQTEEKVNGSMKVEDPLLVVD